MRVKLLHVAIAGALFTMAGVAQAAGVGQASSTGGERLVCDQPLSRGQNSCLLYTPGSAPQRATVMPGTTGEQGVIIRPEGAAVAQPGVSVPSSAPSESTPGKMVYFVEPIASGRVVRELGSARDARNDAFPDPSPPSVAPSPRESGVVRPLKQ